MRLRLFAVTIDEWIRKGLASGYVIFLGVMAAVTVGMLLAEMW